MKDFSPIVAYRVGRYFRSWCVKEYRANGCWEVVNVCAIEELAMVRLAERAARKGMVVAEDGKSAAMRQDALKCD